MMMLKVTLPLKPLNTNVVVSLMPLPDTVPVGVAAEVQTLLFLLAEEPVLVE